MKISKNIEYWFVRFIVLAILIFFITGIIHFISGIVVNINKLDTQIQVSNIHNKNLFSKPTIIYENNDEKTYNCDYDNNFIKSCVHYDLGNNNYKLVIEYK